MHEPSQRENPVLRLRKPSERQERPSPPHDVVHGDYSKSYARPSYSINLNDTTVDMLTSIGFPSDVAQKIMTRGPFKDYDELMKKIPNFFTKQIIANFEEEGGVLEPVDESTKEHTSNNGQSQKGEGSSSSSPRHSHASSARQSVSEPAAKRLKLSDQADKPNEKGLKVVMRVPRTESTRKKAVSARSSTGVTTSGGQQSARPLVTRIGKQITPTSAPFVQRDFPYFSLLYPNGISKPSTIQSSHNRASSQQLQQKDPPSKVTNGSSANVTASLPTSFSSLSAHTAPLTASFPATSTARPVPSTAKSTSSSNPQPSKSKSTAKGPKSAKTSSPSQASRSGGPSKQRAQSSTDSSSKAASSKVSNKITLQTEIVKQLHQDAQQLTWVDDDLQVTAHSASGSELGVFGLKQLVLHVAENPASHFAVVLIQPGLYSAAEEAWKAVYITLGKGPSADVLVLLVLGGYSNPCVQVTTKGREESYREWYPMRISPQQRVGLSGAAELVLQHWARLRCMEVASTKTFDRFVLSEMRSKEFADFFRRACRKAPTKGRRRAKETSSSHGTASGTRPVLDELLDSLATLRAQAYTQVGIFDHTLSLFGTLKEQIASRVDSAEEIELVYRQRDTAVHDNKLLRQRVRYLEGLLSGNNIPFQPAISSSMVGSVRDPPSGDTSSLVSGYLPTSVATHTPVSSSQMTAIAPASNTMWLDPATSQHAGAFAASSGTFASRPRPSARPTGFGYGASLQTSLQTSIAASDDTSSTDPPPAIPVSPLPAFTRS